MPDSLSVNRLKIFLTCHQKFDLRYNSGIEPLGTPEYFTMGKFFHFVANKLYETQSIDETIDETNKEIDRYFEDADGTKFLYAKNYKEKEEYKILLAVISDEWDRTFRIPDEQCGLQIISSELKWEGKCFADKDIPFVFIPDKIVRFDNAPLLEQGIYLIEYKSTSEYSFDYRQRLINDPQTYCYLAYVEQIMQQEVKGVIYRILQKPKIQKLKRDDLDQYKEKLTKYFEQNKALHSFLIPKDEKMIALYKENEAKILKNITFSEQQKSYYMNTENCFGRYGQKCAYYPYCYKENDYKYLYKERGEE